MTTLEIFEKVNLILPIEQRRFFNYLDDTISELRSMYGDNFVFENYESDGEYPSPKDLSDEIFVKPLYHNAIIENIIFAAGGDSGRKTEFLRKARDAYLSYWNENARGRTMKKARW